jgi:hypothetical protein
VPNALSWQKSTYCGSNACVEVQRTPDGGALMRDSKNPDVEPLVYTAEEWAAFILGVKAGEFDR